MIGNEEVQAVVLAVIVVGSVFAAAVALRPEVVEPFTALGLLNEDCLIGDYPRRALVGDNLTLCIFVSNYMGRPVYYKVVYKVGTNETIPSNETASPMPPLVEWRGALDHSSNATFKVLVPFTPPEGFKGGRVALIFELWLYNPDAGVWEYSGRWTHIYVEPVAPGGGT